MADSLPSVNFGFDDLRAHMARFTVRFDKFIEEGRKRVLEDRNHFRMNVAEIQGTKKALAKLRNHLFSKRMILLTFLLHRGSAHEETRH